MPREEVFPNGNATKRIGELDGHFHLRREEILEPAGQGSASGEQDAIDVVGVSVRLQVDQASLERSSEIVAVGADDRIHVVSTNGSLNPGMVRICLWNSASDLDKGMGSGEGEPRHIARNQYQAVCDWYPAGPDPVTWVFYRATEAGEMEQVGSYELDATGYDGVTIIFEWVADAPPLSPPWQRGALR